MKKNIDSSLIELNKIIKIYDNEYTAVDGINLSIKKGEFVTLLGPSGCGKTTTLRMIAGFESPSFGQIKIKGLDIKKVPPYNRPTATVFQNYSLFPHMNVYQNITYGLKVMTVRLDDVKESKIKEIEKNFEKETRIANKEARKLDKIKNQILRDIEKINSLYMTDKTLYSIRKMREKNFSRRIEILEERVENAKTAKEKTINQKTLENICFWYEKKKPIDKKMDKKLKELQKIENEISFIISRPFLKKEQMEEKNLSRKLTKKEIHEKVLNVLKKVGLEGYEEKPISNLSGGQQQRVALARAIVIEPEILLLDEPLSALDAKVRKDLQFELKRLHKELGITFILVTHDQEEALTLSSKIVVMSKGKIEQIGAPNKIYDSPANEWVARFVGIANIFDATYLSSGKVQIKNYHVSTDVKKGFLDNEKVLVMIRPEDFDITEKEKGIISVIVKSAIYKGQLWELKCDFEGQEILIDNIDYVRVGKRVGLRWDDADVHVMKINKENF